MADLEHQARNLIAKWHAERAKSYPSDSVTQSGYNAALKRCADELEAALTQQNNQNEIDRLDSLLDEVMKERDHAYEIIDKLCDAVLGTDRNEWSSAYFFEDAVEEVEDRMYALTSAQDNAGHRARELQFPSFPEGRLFAHGEIVYSQKQMREFAADTFAMNVNLTRAQGNADGEGEATTWIFYFTDDEHTPFVTYCPSREAVETAVIDWLGEDSVNDWGDRMAPAIASELVERGSFNAEDGRCYLKPVNNTRPAAQVQQDVVIERVTDYLCEQEYDIGGRDELRAHVAAAIRSAVEISRGAGTEQAHG